MEDFDNEVFEFGDKTEETNNFNYENISGLGESNYENEDLFTDVSPVNNTNTTNNDFNTWNNDVINPISPVIEDNIFAAPVQSNVQDAAIPAMENVQQVSDNVLNVDPFSAINEQESKDGLAIDVKETPVEDLQKLAEEEENKKPTIEQPSVDTMFNVPTTLQAEEPKADEIPSIEVSQSEPVMPTIETPATIEPLEVPAMEQVQPTEPVVEEQPVVEPIVEQTEPIPEPEVSDTPVTMSETPIEDLQKLTEYEEEKIDSTDINSLFNKLSVNVKDASDIFVKNSNLKEKIDTRFEELKSLQGELENSRRKQMEEIDKYRDEVLDKLTEKKSEIEKRLNTLKELQATLEKEKTEFEEYKRKEQANISKVQKEVQAAYDERREELEHIEDVLRKQKDALDEERNQLGLDKIQYEADKNELANNLLKFNQIVSSFTNGLEIKPEE